MNQNEKTKTVTLPASIAVMYPCPLAGALVIMADTVKYAPPDFPPLANTTTKKCRAFPQRNLVVTMTGHADQHRLNFQTNTLILDKTYWDDIAEVIEHNPDPALDQLASLVGASVQTAKNIYHQQNQNVESPLPANSTEIRMYQWNDNTLPQAYSIQCPVQLDQPPVIAEMNLLQISFVATGTTEVLSALMLLRWQQANPVLIPFCNDRPPLADHVLPEAQIGLAVGALAKLAHLTSQISPYVGPNVDLFVLRPGSVEQLYNNKSAREILIEMGAAGLG